MLDPEADTVEGNTSSRSSIPDSGRVLNFARESTEVTEVTVAAAAAAAALDEARERSGGTGGATGRSAPPPFFAAALGRPTGDTTTTAGVAAGCFPPSWFLC